MALRTPLSVTPHLYMGDSTGRPLDMGTVYFGEQDKDPEFYPIELFSDDELTKPLAQPVHTKGGYLYDKGDMVEPHAKEIIYSVKVLDSYGRKVFYKGAMMRNSWNDDVIEQINAAIIDSADVARQVATDITNEAINNTAVEGGVLADTFVTMTARTGGMLARNLRDKNAESMSVKDFGAIGDGTLHTLQEWIDSGKFSSIEDIRAKLGGIFPERIVDLTDSIDRVAIQAALFQGGSIKVPDGTYIMDCEVVPVSNTVFFGTGKSILKLIDYQEKTVWQYRHIINVREQSLTIGVENVYIHNLTIDGNVDIQNITGGDSRYPSNGVTGIRIAGNANGDENLVRNIHVFNNKLINLGLEKDGIYTGLSSNVYIQDNYVFNAGRSLIVVAGCTNSYVTGNIGMRAKNSFVDYETHKLSERTINSECTGNIFMADELCTAIGFGLTGLGVQRNVNISDNVIVTNRGFGSLGGDSNTISNNIVYVKPNTSPYGTLNSNKAESCIIENNKIVYISDVQEGTPLLYAFRLRGLSDSIVKGNSISSEVELSAQTTGIYISSSNDTTNTRGNIIESNNISGFVNGIVMDGDATSGGARVTGNTLRLLGGAGIESLSADTLIHGNSIYGAKKNIRVYKGVRNTVSDNHLINMEDLDGAWGVNVLEGHHCNIKGNTIFINSIDCITLQASENNIIEGNTIVGTSTTGLNIHDTSNNALVLGNNINVETGNAIYLRGKSALISNNKLKAAVAFKFLSTRGHDPVITSNDLRECIALTDGVDPVRFKPSPLLALHADTVFTFVDELSALNHTK